MNTYDDKEIKDVKWVKYKIVVPTEEDRQELMEAFEHIHYADVDSNFVPVNQLIHEYMTPERSGNPETKNNIIVDADRYQQITKEYKVDVPLEVTEALEEVFTNLSAWTTKEQQTAIYHFYRGMKDKLGIEHDN